MVLRESLAIFVVPTQNAVVPSFHFIYYYYTVFVHIFLIKIINTTSSFFDVFGLAVSIACIESRKVEEHKSTSSSII